jgi:hypothetical protein
MDSPVGISEQGRDGRPVVQVGDRRGRAARRDGLGASVVAHQRRHLVAMLLQFVQYVRPDESCRTGKCHLHYVASTA